MELCSEVLAREQSLRDEIERLTKENARLTWERDVFHGWWECARGIADKQDARMRGRNGSLKV